MNILYHHRTQAVNAEGVHIREMIRALEKLGHRVVAVSPPGVRLDKPASGGSSSANKRSLWKLLARRLPAFLFECLELAYNLVGSRACRRAAREAGINLVYERYTFFCRAGAACARAFGVPLFLEVNYTTATPLVRRKSRLLKGLARRMEDRNFRQAAALFVVSSYLKKELIDRGIPAEKIYLAPNAVDEETFAVPADGAAVRQRWTPGCSHVIGYVGAFFPWHGLDFLLDAFSALAGTYPGARLLLIGDGPQLPSLKEQAAAAGLAEKVIFTGSVRYDELPAHIAAMDICVLPDSNNYGSPMKIFEYMAAGRTVLAPRLGPLQDVISDGENGVLFTQRDREDFAARLKELLDDPRKRERIAAAARSTIMNKHLWRHNAGMMVEACEKTTARGRERS